MRDGARRYSFPSFESQVRCVVYSVQLQEVRGLSLGKLLHTHNVVVGASASLLDALSRDTRLPCSDTAPRRTRLDLLGQQLVRQVLSVS